MRCALRFWVLLFAALCVLVVANFGMTAINQSKRNETYKELELFADALAFVQAQYVDEAPAKDLIYGALTGLMASLDPHSQFLTPEDHEDLKADTAGHFGGVGIEITLKDRLVTVITPIEGTPAWEAGVQPHDRIVKIDETVLKNVKLHEAVKMLRGKPGTDVTIVVWREKENKLLTFKIRRATIEIKDIKEARILEDGIGYIKLVEFSEETTRHVDKALADLKSRGMDALIFDLRNNPGGLLDQAVEVTERFIPAGQLVVSMKGREPSQDAVFMSRYRTPYTDIPIVLLINEGSASGSEILAGCLKDLKRAILVGGQTFGKGSVQTVLPLRDGSALKVTTARYYTPSGVSIHETGIMPDVMAPQETSARIDQEKPETSLEEIFEDVEKKTSQKDEVSDVKELYLRDIPLSRAVDLIKGIKIYQKMVVVKDQKRVS
ncbi:MAG: S41 family peptidase [Candidatus Omnitrophica bacterium]|nr:S41 family peptidase [Candidatus Omnitrophota bacterium]MDD5573954.1 S41 family peptidase [Candidatus Omnitrophota bacterium]